MQDGYSICLNKWALDKSIRNELALLLIISSLCAEKGFCWASNEYLAKTLGDSKETISRKITKLTKAGYLVAEYEKRGGEVVSRKLRMTISSFDGYQIRHSTDDENDKENNISIKNISIKNNSTNVLLAKPEQYGNPEINEMFAFWASAVSPITANIQKNRHACKNLLKKYGREDLQKYILLVSKAKSDRYAPMIADFIDLQSRADRLKTWALRKVTPQQENSQIASVDDI